MKVIIELNEVEVKGAIESGVFASLIGKTDQLSLRREGTAGDAAGVMAQPTDATTTASVVPLTIDGQAIATAVTPLAMPMPTTTAPTSATEYSMDDLAIAAMGLMDKGMQPQLQELLKSLGVEALPQLPKEQYGMFATALRNLGGQI